MGNYPWLADSWPTTNLVHSGKEPVNCCTTNHSTAERYYNGRTLQTLVEAMSMSTLYPPSKHLSKLHEPVHFQAKAN